MLGKAHLAIYNSGHTLSNFQRVSLWQTKIQLYIYRDVDTCWHTHISIQETILWLVTLKWIRLILSSQAHYKLFTRVDTEWSGVGVSPWHTPGGFRFSVPPRCAVRVCDRRRRGERNLLCDLLGQLGAGGGRVGRKDAVSTSWNVHFPVTIRQLRRVRDQRPVTSETPKGHVPWESNAIWVGFFFLICFVLFGLFFL